MLTEAQNERLTRIGPGTPCGQLLRRYWQPLCAAGALTKEHPKKRVKILGEELVVFMNDQGEYGAVAERCVHRGVSLYYGFVEPDGIRCSYHGWKYDVAGNCVEQPFEPNTGFREKVCQPAYPVQHLAGMLFVYMGPQPAPLLPRWDVLARQDGRRLIQISPHLNCNWLQIQENTVDSVHTYYLHAHMLATMGIPGGDYFYRPIVDYSWAFCEWGIEKELVYGGEKPEVEIRPPLVFPNILRIPQGPFECLHWRVPIDDTHTQIFIMAFNPMARPDKSGPSEEVAFEYLPPVIGPDGEYDLGGALKQGDLGPNASIAFYAQDAMAWETQGQIFDRSSEHLGATDQGIIMFRKLLADQIDIVENGGEPMALVRDEARNQIIEFPSRSRAAVAPTG